MKIKHLWKGMHRGTDTGMTWEGWKGEERREKQKVVKVVDASSEDKGEHTVTEYPCFWSHLRCLIFPKSYILGLGL